MTQLLHAEYQWALTNNFDKPFSVHKLMLKLISEHFPDLFEIFELKGPFKSRTLEGPNFLVIELSGNLGAQVPTCGPLPLEEIQKILDTLPKSEISFEVVSKNFEVNFEKCVFISHVVNGNASWKCIHSQVVEWLNMHALPRIESLNCIRVRRALPEAKSYNPQNILEHLVILEDELAMIQGSAFRINDGTFVTCAHSLGTDSKAIFPNDPSTRLNIEVILSNSDIDLAIFSILNAEKKVGLSIGTADSIVQLSQICVVGFPNYQTGDRGVLVPGNSVPSATFLDYKN